MSNRIRLFKNFTALSTLQATEYLLPLITIPYIIRVIGPEKFGLLAFATAFAMYFQMFTEYGLSYTATRDTAYNRNNKNKLEEIFNSVLALKTVLLIISFILFSAIVFFFERFRSDSQIYLLTFGAVIGNSIFPSWLYQGLEKMKHLAVINIATRLMYTLGILIFVKEINDFAYIPLINAICLIIGGSVALLLIKKISSIRIRFPSLAHVRYWIKRGWHVSSATISMGIYLQSRTFILGLLTNNIIVGYYSLAEKLASIINMFPLSAFLTTITPWITTIYKKNKDAAISTLRKLQNATLIYFIAVVIFCLTFTEKIVSLFAGSAYTETVIATRGLLIAVFFVGINALRMQQFVIQGDDKRFSGINIIASVLGLVLTIVLTWLFSYTGTVAAFIAVAVFAWLASVIKRKHEAE